MSVRPPLIALVGRPNVGKSTLFNRLVGSKTSLVYDRPGVTRDRIFGETIVEDKLYRVVDTGGIEIASDDFFFDAMREQTQLAIEEADLIVLMLDGQTGVNPEDAEIARILRKSGKTVIAVVNKLDVYAHLDRAHQFYELGYETIVGMSSEHDIGMDEFLTAVTEKLDAPLAQEYKSLSGGIPTQEEEPEEGTISKIEWDGGPIRVAVIGRPNAGKSSLINQLIGEDRLLATHVAGTTRDPVDTDLCVDDQEYILVDPAGIRRKRSIGDQLEQFAVVAAVRSLDEADVALLVLDAGDPVADQDAKIASLANERGKGIIIVANKWDLLEEKSRIEYEDRLRRRLRFLDYSPLIRVSAKTGRNVKRVLPMVLSAQKERHRRIATSELNRFFQDVVETLSPASRGGKKPKLFFVSQPLVRPPTFVFKTRRGEDIQDSYKRYLENSLRDRYGFEASPLWIKFRESSQKKHPAGKRIKRASK